MRVVSAISSLCDRGPMRTRRDRGRREESKGEGEGRKGAHVRSGCKRCARHTPEETYTGGELADAMGR